MYRNVVYREKFSDGDIVDATWEIDIKNKKLIAPFISNSETKGECVEKTLIIDDKTYSVRCNEHGHMNCNSIDDKEYVVIASYQINENEITMTPNQIINKDALSGTGLDIILSPPNTLTINL